MSYHLGKFGNIMLLLVLSLFAFSTIITVYYYGESNLKLLTKNKKAITLLKIIAIFSILGGGITKSSNVWNTIDTLLALLSIINVYSIYILRKEIIPNPNKK